MKILCTKRPKRRPISKLASKVYTPKQIMKKALTAFHGNEPMLQVFNNIIHDPHVTLGDPDRGGRFPLFYDDEDIGWIDLERGRGWIDDKAYPKIAKYDGPLFDEYEDEYDDEYEDDEYEYDDLNASTKLKRGRKHS